MNDTDSKYGLFIANNFWSLFGAGYALFWDLVCGTFAFSVLICPIWLLLSVIRSCIVRPGWRIALCRAAVPPAILGITLANTLNQWKKADVNGERIVRACESYHALKGHYPKTLDELVPRYLRSIPRATYGAGGEFIYYNAPESDGQAPTLWWNPFIPEKKVYSFEHGRWYYTD
jgi:hypothetical protein